MGVPHCITGVLAPHLWPPKHSGSTQNRSNHTAFPFQPLEILHFSSYCIRLPLSELLKQAKQISQILTFPINQAPSLVLPRGLGPVEPIDR